MTLPASEAEAALVFVHCFGGSAQSWEPVVASLGPSIRAYAIDLPGFGDAAAAPGPYTVAAYADFVQAKVRALGLERYILIGHSMGGKVALALAARRPAGLCALILLAPSPPTPEPTEDEARAALIDGWAQYSVASQILARVTASPLCERDRKQAVDDIMRTGKAAWTAWLACGSREDISADMACISVPVTIVSGTEDIVLPTALLQREIAARLRPARMVRVPGAGHLLPQEATGAVVAAITSARTQEKADGGQSRAAA